MFRNAHVLVTGGAGFVGVNLIQRLLALGANVTATLHKTPPVLVDRRITYITGDLRNAEHCRRAVAGSDYVFMCAANTSGAAVIDQAPLVHLTPNVLMNLLMLEAAYEARVKKFLFISSNIVYPVTDYPVAESDVTNEFFDKYFIAAWMKRFTEVVCEMYATKIRQPMQVIVVRPANIYGEYDDFAWETSHVIPALLRKVVERHNPIEVWGDGNDLKEFIYVQDFIDGMLLAMEKVDSFDPVNIAAGQPCTVRDVLRTLLQLDNHCDATIIFDTSKPTMIPKRLIDIRKATTQLGFRPRVTLEEGLRRTLAWYRHTLQHKYMA